MPKISVNLLQRQKREYERLTEIYGNCPKYVLTADEFSGATYDGIKTVIANRLILIEPNRPIFSLPLVILKLEIL